MRIDALEDGSSAGVYCTSADGTHVRTWRLEDPRMDTRTHRSQTTTSITWRRRAGAGGLARDRTYVLTAPAYGARERITQRVMNAGERTVSMLEMRPGAHPQGCLTRLAHR